MWSLEEAAKILDVFPEALNSDILIPRPPSTLHAQLYLDNLTTVKETKDKVSEKNTANGAMSLVDPTWELLDPSPDIRALFSSFDMTYFDGHLGAVEVRWSPRMTLCAGLCCYEGRGGLCSIRLSEPLLKLRPRSDLVETLLHEMIHAYLFVTQRDRDRDGHGPSFRFHMNRINAEAGTRITVYHTFHDEVANYQTHWWRCTGPCRERSPFYGYVRRAMNRAPGPNDNWWGQHQATCSGFFVKIREPEKKLKMSRQVCKREKESKPYTLPTIGCSDIKKFFSIDAVGSSTSKLQADSSCSSSVDTSTPRAVAVESPTCHVLGGSLPRHQSRLLSLCSSQAPGDSKTLESKANILIDSADAPGGSIRTVTCPVCTVVVSESSINEHLDICLEASMNC